MSTLKLMIKNAMKEAMRAKEKDRLGTIRMIQSAIKQIEVDERSEIDDQRILAILDKLVKQRKDAAAQFADADRPDLAAKEEAEIQVLQAFLPQPIGEAELDALVAAAIAQTNVQGMQAMGQVMAQLKPQLQGRADMAQVSAKVKAILTA